MNIAIFASGSGTNAEAIIQAVKAGKLDATISLIFSDNPSAKVIERAKNHGIPVVVETPKSFANKEEYERKILDYLTEKGVQFIVLAGYMRLVGSTILDAFEGKMVNIHPSLLPSFPGLDAIGQAFRAKVKVTGVTIHYVDSGMDTGPIIAQEPVRIEESDTLETLEEKIHAVEHELYPRTLQMIFDNLKKGLEHNE